MKNSQNNIPFFSVIISNYNYGSFIGEAIGSVLDQSFPLKDVEILVVDDGSTDDSREIIRKYAQRVTAIFQDNRGQAAALNTGMQNAHGRFIALLDSDDIWHKDKLKRIADEFEKTESVDFVFHFLHVIDHEKKTIDRYIVPKPCPDACICPGALYRERYLQGHLPWFSPTSGLSIRAECLRKVLPIPEDFRIAADFYLHYIVPLYARKICLIEKPLAYYRMHGTNVSGGTLMTAENVRKHIDHMEFLLPCLDKHLRELGCNGDVLKKRFSSMVRKYSLLYSSMRDSKLKALKDMILFNDFLPDDSMFYRMVVRLTTLMHVLSPSLYQRLLRQYRKSLCLLDKTS
jgi:glycosyltransferase involved in cell wall biosynthesis